MKAFKVFLLVVLTILLVGGLVGLQVAALGLEALSPALYLRVLRSSHAIEKAPDILMGFFGEEIGQLPGEERARLEAAVREALEPAWVEGEIAPALTDLAMVLRGRREELSAVLHVDVMGQRIVDAYAKTGHPYIVSQLRQGMREMFPRPLALGELGLGDDKTFAEVAKNVRFGLKVVSVALAAVLLVVLLCFLLAGGFVGGARWVGAAVLSAGILGAAGAVAVAVLGPGLVAGVELADAPEVVAHLVSDVLLGLVSRLALTVGTNAGLLVLVGVVLLVCAGVAAATRARRRTAAATGPGAGTPTS